MSNITDEEIIKKCAKILFENHNPDIDESSVIGQRLISGFLHDLEFLSHYFDIKPRSTLQNKVSDVSAEEIDLASQRAYPIVSGLSNFDALMKRGAFKNGVKWHASIVNKVSDVSAEDFLKEYAPKVCKLLRITSPVKYKQIISAMTEYASRWHVYPSSGHEIKPTHWKPIESQPK